MRLKMLVVLMRMAVHLAGITDISHGWVLRSAAAAGS
jgi:hypothetical protein